MKTPHISKGATFTIITLLILLVVIAGQVLVLGPSTYAWALTHGRQVKMLQRDYDNYDNQYRIENPK